MVGKTQFLLSGQATTDAYAWSPRIDTLEYSEVVLNVEALRGLSGVRYTVRGYSVPGVPYSITSGTLNSGDIVRLHSGLNFAESLRVGVENETAGESGVVSVYSLQKVA